MDSLTVIILVILSLIAGAFIYSQYNKIPVKSYETPIVAPIYSDWYPWWRGSYVTSRYNRFPIHRRQHHRR